MLAMERCTYIQFEPRGQVCRPRFGLHDEGSDWWWLSQVLEVPPESSWRCQQPCRLALAPCMRFVKHRNHGGARAGSPIRVDLMSEAKW